MRRAGPLVDWEGFEWDSGNVDKNWRKHRVTAEDAEAIFFHEPLIVRLDATHSTREQRYLR